MRLWGWEGRLSHVELGSAHAGRPGRPCPPGLERFAILLRDYLRGRDMCIEAWELETDDMGGLRREVCLELLKVGFGQLVSYGELARRVGRPGAARAVGQAVGANPFPIFVPCHRVVCRDGRPGGFSAGREWKARLLRHEGWGAWRDSGPSGGPLRRVEQA